jgi:hypothetical protein
METVKKANFYDEFQIGIELEMEIPRAENQCQNTPRLEWKGDGSLRETKDGSRVIELVSRKPWKTQDDENKFIEEMKLQAKEFKSKQNEDIYAYRNTSCGTHYHFSFKNKPAELLWVFDSIEFERDFFNAYMKEFKSEKFLERINAKYCRAPFLYSAAGPATKPNEIKKDLKNLGIVSFSDEKERTTDGTRYRWLNMEALRNNTGIEIRVFPHIQTYNGIKKVNNFVKKVVLDYFSKPSTQAKIQLLQHYEENIKNSRIKEDRLSELKLIAYQALRVNERNKKDLSGEIRILLAKWTIQQPTLINSKEAII